MRGAKLLVISLTAVYTVIGVPLVAAGVWLVLPFAGLELLVLAVCLYLALQYSARCEVISVDQRIVTVESGRRCAEKRNEYQRAWVQVRLHESPHRWYPSRLVIGSHGRFVEVGAFLLEDERREFARELARLIGGSGEDRAAGAGAETQQ